MKRINGVVFVPQSGDRHMTLCILALMAESLKGGMRVMQNVVRASPL